MSVLPRRSPLPRNCQAGDAIRDCIAAQLLAATLLCWVATGAGPAHAHGSVTPGADLCLIEIGYFRAHFKIYQPARHGHDDFCEDLPTAGYSVFVMEYEHAGLNTAAIDFRIIENPTDLGRFTRLTDVRGLGDLEALTVYHHPAAPQADVFTAAHRFAGTGEFVGIVTVTAPNSGKSYTAVFPFEVGYTDWGYWPYIVVVAILLQLNFLGFSGRLAPLWQRLRGRGK